ncbi:MlaD family protein [Amphritea sp. HPY]|uniref:MlaD family protein n=1 Tax=Amphritea sp. HPY TaxID=3421652 RepID=UPI003D7E78C5
MTREHDDSPATPVIKKHHGPSVVWLLPLLAAMIAGWLVVKSYQEAGIMIEVQFDSAQGLEADITQVMYRGLPTGKVKSLQLNDDLQSVTAIIEMAAETEDVLVQGARFWLVKPQVSLSGVRGLETLFSGYYIEFQPGTGDETKKFVADNEPPPPLRNQAGLYISLIADSAQSIYRGAKVFHRQIEVGEVIDFRLASNGKQVHVDLHIDPAYSHLINNRTRFWNASGVTLKMDLPQIEVHFNSLASIIAGGISFYTPAGEEQPLDSNRTFTLYNDYEAAEDGVRVSVEFSARTPLHEGTRVVSQGIEIGRVQRLEFSPDLSTQTAYLLIDPRAKPLLRAGSRFWLPEPQFSLSQLKQVSELITGKAIEMQPGPGAPRFKFTALNTPPAKQPGPPGLDIQLVSDQLGSLSYGSPILYRQIPVGEIRGYELIEGGHKVLIHGTIKPEHAALVKQHSRFWNSSGIKFSAGTDGVKLETGSAATVISGGISFFTPHTREQKEITPEHRFHLFNNFDNASNQGRLLYRENAGKLPLRLKAESLGSVSVGSPVLFKQVEVGKVSHYALAKDGNNVIIHLLIDATYKHLVTDQSRFWNASGITAELNLQGVDLRTESIAALLDGGIAFANLNRPGNAAKPRQLFTLHPNAEKGLQQGPTIKVSFAAGPDLSNGAEVRYKGLEMGRVEQVSLTGADGSIEATIALNQQGALLARRGSQFWIAEPAISLAGIDNPQALLFGNHIEALPGTGDPVTTFSGQPSPPTRPQPAGLNIILETPQLGSIELGSLLYYRGIPVGKVTGYELSENKQKVELYANIQPRYSELVTHASRFWEISGFSAEFGLFSGLELKTDNLDSFVRGGIAFINPTEAPAAAADSRFKLNSQAPN